MSSTAIHQRLARAGDGLAEEAIIWGQRDTPSKPVALTDRDLRLMALLYQVNFLSASQLAILGWGHDSNAATRRLRLLHATGHLDKFRAPKRIGTSEWNYRITRQGWQALKDHHLTTETHHTQPELHSISYAEHDLQLNTLIIHIAQAAAPPGNTGLIDRMPFTWLGPRTGRMDPTPKNKPPKTPRLPPGTQLHPEQSRRGSIEPDATLIGGASENQFAIWIEYDRTRRPHKQIDRLRRYDHWLLYQWEETHYNNHAMPPTLLLLTDHDQPLNNLIQTTDKTLTAWHAPLHITQANGTHPARQRTIITSRTQILQNNWTMHRPPNLPSTICARANPMPRTVNYDVSDLLGISPAGETP